MTCETAPLDYLPEFMPAALNRVLMASPTVPLSLLRSIRFVLFDVSDAWFYRCPAFHPPPHTLGDVGPDSPVDGDLRVSFIVVTSVGHVRVDVLGDPAIDTSRKD